MSVEHYDLIIIGTGGGTKLRPAADLGKRIAIIERDAPGGTCLNYGCIPSKMLIYPADLLQEQKELSRFHIQQSSDFTFDWERLITEVNQRVAQDSQNIPHFYQRHPNIDFYVGHGRFIGPKTIAVNDQQISAEKIYVATGSRPSIPPIPGLEGTPYMTSREALKRSEKPESLIVIGGGYIAVELGHFYHSVGVDTHFLVRSGLLKNEDQDIQALFTEHFSRGKKISLGASPQKVEYDGQQFSVTYQQDGQIQKTKAQALLVATGVRPNSDDLGLETTGINTDSQGFIRVNSHLETNEKGVYALGDVVGNYLFRHSVNFEGEYLFQQHFSAENPSPIQYPPMPHAVFSFPTVAGVGVTEQELIKMNKKVDQDYIVAEQHYANSAMGMAMRPEVGMIKLLIDPASHQLLGSHIIGARATELLQFLVLAQTMKIEVEKLLDLIYIHPALSENVRNALRKAVKKLK